MKPLIVMITLLILIASLAAQSACAHGTESNTHEHPDPSMHRDCCGNKDAVPEHDKNGGNSNSREGYFGDEKSFVGADLTKTLENFSKAFEKMNTDCLKGQAPNTLLGKFGCSLAAQYEQLKKVQAENLTADRTVREAQAEALREALEAFKEALKGHEARAQKNALDVNAGLRLNDPNGWTFTKCSFEVISTDGKPTGFKLANYSQAGTQQLVDNLRIIDPHAEIYFNDPKIVGVKQDNDREHDGKILVAWSSDPLSLEGAKLLAKSNPIAVQLLLALTPDEREEALAEYKEFDFSLGEFDFLFAKEYVKVGAPHLWTELKVLRDKQRAWEMEKQAFATEYSEYDGSDTPVVEFEKKRKAWERDEPGLVSAITAQIMEHLKTADPIAIEATKKAQYAWDNEIRDLNERFRKVFRKGGPAVDEVLKKIDEQLRIQKFEQAEFNFALERFKNQDPIALMAALKALEEKCCEPSEAQRRKALRETKAAEHRKARYEAVKAKLQQKLHEAWLLEQHEAWVRKQDEAFIRGQKTHGGKDQ